MAYLIKRTVKRDGKERFTGVYQAEDGTYKSAGTFDTSERALEVAEAQERHQRLKLAEVDPAVKATITIEEFTEKFLREADIEPNSKQVYSGHLRTHVVPYIGKRRIAEVSRETIHRLFTVTLKEEAGATQSTILHVRTALSAMLQMAWDHGYREDNPVRGIKLKGVPTKPIVVATVEQFQRVHTALPHQPAKVFARLGVSSGLRYCELISLVPEDFNYSTDMLTVSKSTVEVTSAFHPSGFRFVTRQYTKNGEHRRFKIDHAVAVMVQEHVAAHGIGPGELIFPVRLFASTEQSGRVRMPASEIEALGCIEAPNGISYAHGTLGGYVTAKCRCRACKQWSADYARGRKRDRTGRTERVWNPDRRRIDPTEYMGDDLWRRIWNAAVTAAGLPFRYTPYQVRHTHASWLIDQGVDLARVQYRLGHGDLQATTRYVKILDEEDTKAADVMANLLGDVA